MWSELDNRVTNGEMMLCFRKHLQSAFNAGVSASAEIADEADNCGTDTDPQHRIPYEIAKGIRALVEN
jgi:hypothetical protein